MRNIGSSNYFNGVSSLKTEDSQLFSLMRIISSLEMPLKQFFSLCGNFKNESSPIINKKVEQIVKKILENQNISERNSLKENPKEYEIDEIYDKCLKGFDFKKKTTPQSIENKNNNYEIIASYNENTIRTERLSF